MRTMSHYLIIMLSIILFVFRLIVVFTTTMGIEFGITALNVNLEIGLLLVMIICIILMARSKLSGAVILLVFSIAYYGADILEKFTYISQGGILSMDIALQLVVSIVCVLVPVFAFFIIAFAKEQEKRPVDKKTDFFYKNEAYDRKYDERADRNNYRTM